MNISWRTNASSKGGSNHNAVSVKKSSEDDFNKLIRTIQKHIQK